jgi:hypothetical protein
MLTKETSKMELSIHWITQEPYSEIFLLVVLNTNQIPTNKTNKINMNQQIYFLTLSQDVYEKYTINQHIIIERLGYFVNETTYFDASGIENNSFLRRRQNFHGLTIPAFTGNKL